MLIKLLKANFIFKKDKDYVLVENKVKIIDEISGRMLEGRRYADGLHQAIEAKENVKIEIENQTLLQLLIKTILNYMKNLQDVQGLLDRKSRIF